MFKTIVKTANTGLVVVGLGMAAYGLYQLTTDLIEAASEKIDNWTQDQK